MVGWLGVDRGGVVGWVGVGVVEWMGVGWVGVGVVGWVVVEWGEVGRGGAEGWVGVWWVGVGVVGWCGVGRGGRMVVDGYSGRVVVVGWVVLEGWWMV